MADERKNKAISIGGEAFTEALKNYGPTVVLEHLVWISSTRSDWVIDELLMLYPTVVATAELLQRCGEKRNHLGKKTHLFEMDTEVVVKKLKNDPDWLKKQGVLML